MGKSATVQGHAAIICDEGVEDMSRLKQAWEVGNMVTTDFSGEKTVHKVTATKQGQCESGLLVQVTPCVPKSHGITAWLDANWFEPYNTKITGA